MVWLTTPAWIQIGWAAGCVGSEPQVQCFNSSPGLFEELLYPNGTYSVTSDGSLAYSSADTYRIEYYPSTAVWKVFDNYNHWLRDVTDMPTSGAPTISTEVFNGNTPGHAVEMPLTTFGSSNPNTNAGMRIKGANGWVVWSTSLSSHYTTKYDESNCPNPTWCQSGPPVYGVPFYLSVYNANYYLSGHD